MYVEVKKKIKAAYLNMSVAVRYDEEDMPNNAPLRDGDVWSAVVDLYTKKIVDWPVGQELKIEDMKITDQGLYEIMDKDKNVLISIDGYVPNRLLPGDYGDYLSLTINAEGEITNWLSSANLHDFEHYDDA